MQYESACSNLMVMPACHSAFFVLWVWLSAGEGSWGGKQGEGWQIGRAEIETVATGILPRYLCFDRTMPDSTACAMHVYQQEP
jgi:hypothetical protein